MSPATPALTCSISLCRVSSGPACPNLPVPHDSFQLPFGFVGPTWSWRKLHVLIVTVKGDT